MTTTRRSFLVGVGSVITAGFLAKANAFALDTEQPLLIKPATSTDVIYYERFEDHWRLHLGKPVFELPEPQSLIENLRFHGYVLDTQTQIDACCSETGWSEVDLYSPMKEEDWEDQWAYNLNPEARAFEFLQANDIFPRRASRSQAGNVIFQDYANPMSNWRWVEVHDPLSLSLLQARLTELSLPIEVQEFAAQR